MHFHEADTQAEAVLEHDLEMVEADAVDDVLVHGPALQPVQVLVPPLVALRQESPPAVLALDADGGAADHLAADAPRRELQVVGELGDDPAGQCRVSRLPLQRGQVSLLNSTSLLTGSFARFLRFPAPRHALLTDLAGAEEDLLPLVVEVGTAVDVVEVLEGELGPAPLPAARRDLDLVRPGDGGAAWAAVAPFASAACRLADGLDELRDLPQGGTVLGVVGEQLVLPDGLPGLLPACPPHQALEAGGVLVRPGAAEVAADLLQPVGEGGEVHAGVDGRQHVHRLARARSTSLFLFTTFLIRRSNAFS